MEISSKQMHYKLNLAHCAEHSITSSGSFFPVDMHTSMNTACIPCRHGSAGGQSALFVISDNIICRSAFLHGKSHDHAGISMVVPQVSTKNSVAQQQKQSCSCDVRLPD